MLWGCKVTNKSAKCKKKYRKKSYSCTSFFYCSYVTVQHPITMPAKEVFLDLFSIAETTKKHNNSPYTAIRSFI